MSPPTHSNVWNFFMKDDSDPDKSMCKICNKYYSRKGRTTTSLKNHLKSMHPNEFSSFERSNNEKQSNNEKDIIMTPLKEIKQEFLLEVEETEETWELDHPNSKKIDKVIGEMIALQNLPFNFVEGLGIKRLIKELAPNYNFRGRKFFTDFVCKDIYAKVASKVEELIKQYNRMSFATAVWTDPISKISLLTLTCYGISENFERNSIMLKCETFDEHHTEEMIAEKLKKMLTEWNISTEQVHCLTLDKGFMKKNTKLALFNDLDCTVNQIQTAIQTGLQSQEYTKDIIQKLKKISSHFNHSSIALKQLETIQDRLNESHVKMVHDCETQYNSTFYMFDCFLKLKDALSLYTNNVNIDVIFSEEWRIIEHWVEILEPFEEATRELSSSQALISSVIPITQILIMKLNDYLKNSLDSDPIRLAVSALKAEFAAKFVSLENNNLYAFANYLDPRYKHKFLTPMTEVKIKRDIINMINNAARSQISSPKNLKRMKMSDPLELEEPGSLTTINTSLKSKLAILLDSSSEDENEDDSSPEAAIKKELLIYRQKKRIHLDENPLDWWRENRFELKLLSEIARQYLSAPPGINVSKQLFSETGLMSHSLRNSLEAEKTAILLFIKYNSIILNFEY